MRITVAILAMAATLIVGWTIGSIYMTLKDYEDFDWEDGDDN
jgi:uncharacterized protein YneF (UPF0154 family)